MPAERGGMKLQERGGTEEKRALFRRALLPLWHRGGAKSTGASMWSFPRGDNELRQFLPNGFLFPFWNNMLRCLLRSWHSLRRTERVWNRFCREQMSLLLTDHHGVLMDQESLLTLNVWRHRTLGTVRCFSTSLSIRTVKQRRRTFSERWLLWGSWVEWGSWWWDPERLMLSDCPVSHGWLVMKPGVNPVMFGFQALLHHLVCFVPGG